MQGSRQEGEPRGPAVAQFLLQEPSFPASVAYGLTRAQAALERIRPKRSPIGIRSAEMLNMLRSGVVGLDVERAIATDIHEILTQMVDRTAEISSAIGEEFFYAAMPESADSEVIEA